MNKFHTRETDHAYEADYKLDVGAECNRLLSHADDLQAQYAGKPTMPMEHAALIADIRSIVERVANFEELEETA